ncbi:uncharacterized protein C8Q71DRAFT_252095 [Rhodofomes roseus]|uniref:Uncharacterized protein n=1 Tax=Rhodofomes roseus TaxID=34475 RepID=A0ABQ8K7C6_9APHY|nr:uncharacterized protein C8Q71DRAFT_252095 [Rhodofomes roseus]KAH9833072.1 hypothetical protein C8Q71DRAFT_252095 [Rhodofomes roseus]
MSVKTWYYQVGGFQGHLREIPDERLLRSPGIQGLNLVLGIRPNGASYLLLPESRFRALRWRPPGARPDPPERFLSLSPAHFPNRAELEKRLKTYASTKSNKGIPKDQIRDRSKANTSFTVAGNGVSEAGKIRSSFEMQRVLVLSRPMLATLDYTQAAEFSLRMLPENLTIVSLCYNTWKADTRTMRQREADPKVLDIGWTTWSKPAQWNGSQIMPSETTHVVIEEERYLSNPGSKRIECEYATTIYKPRSDIAWQLSAALSGRHPVVLLVHDEARTLATLRALKLDTTEWASGIAGLLYDDAPGPVQTMSRSSRSRSPERRGEYTSASQADRSRRPSGTPVYVVDVRSLYLALRQVAPATDSVPINARGLGVKLDPPKDKPQAVTPNVIAESDRWWSAGTESLLLGKMWYSMARGPNIDDQRVLRWSSAQAADATGSSVAPASSPPPTAALPETAEASDDEVDPNDILQPVAAAPAPTSAVSKLGGTKSSLSLMDPDGWDDASDDDW